MKTKLEKNWMALGLLLFCVSSAHAAVKVNEYSCKCVDTGAECDGMENMNVSLKGSIATIDLGSEDWEMNDGFEARLNSKYKARGEDNKNYSQFKIFSGGGGYNFNTKKSNFLIENTLLKGRKSGNVKFQSVSGDEVGGGFYSWLFECSKN